MKIKEQRKISYEKRISLSKDEYEAILEQARIDAEQTIPFDTIYTATFYVGRDENKHMRRPMTLEVVKKSQGISR